MNNLLADTRQARIIQTLTRQAHRGVLVIDEACLVQGHGAGQGGEGDTLQVGCRAGHQHAHQKFKVVLDVREPPDIGHGVAEGSIVKIQAVGTKHPLKFAAVKPQPIGAGANTPLVVFLDQLEVLGLGLRLGEGARQALAVHRSGLLEAHVVGALCRVRRRDSLVGLGLNRVAVHASRAEGVPMLVIRGAQVLAGHSVVLDAVDSSTDKAFDNGLGGSTGQRAGRTRRGGLRILRSQSATVLRHVVIRGKTGTGAEERRQRGDARRERNAPRENSALGHRGQTFL